MEGSQGHIRKEKENTLDTGGAKRDQKKEGSGCELSEPQVN